MPGDVTPEDEATMRSLVISPEDIIVVAAGGKAGGAEPGQARPKAPRTKGSRTQG